MGTHIRIPVLLDVLIVSDAEEILACAADPRLKRGPLLHGPLLNKVINGFAQSTLHAPVGPLPSALPREDPARAKAQKALAARLAAPAPWDDESLDLIADWMGGRKTPLDLACQQAIGRLFVPDFTAKPATWHAAMVLHRSLNSRNPALRVLWQITGETKRAQKVLADAMDGDTSGVHAVGIAVHTFQRAVERMESVLADPALRATVSDAAALGHAMSAPDTVLRHTECYATTAAGHVAPGTIVLLQLDPATHRLADPRIAFLSETWSACPAAQLVPRMLAEIWARATGQRPAARHAA
ncbi:MAG: hypothetical protein AB8B85_10000 [Paracoccaceae bacterium]